MNGDGTEGARVRHRFWQPGGGYDRNIRSTEALRAMIDYIHDNPVRRGLVANAEDWNGPARAGTLEYGLLKSRWMGQVLVELARGWRLCQFGTPFGLPQGVRPRAVPKDF